MKSFFNIPLNLKENTAILVIDIQNSYCSTKGSMARLGHDLYHFENIVENINKFLNKTRSFKIPIIFTRMIEDYNLMLPNAKLKMKNLEQEKRRISPAGSFEFKYFQIKPSSNDFQIIKRSYDVFTNPKFDKLLKKLKVKNIIILGAYSDVCVDTTLRSAYSRGYNVIIPKDLVSTVGDRIKNQKNLFKIWDTFFAFTLNSEDIIEVLKDN